MMHKTDSQNVGSTSSITALDRDTAQDGAVASEQMPSCIRHELVNANHAILLGANLLSRYWDDIISSLDQYDGCCDDLFSSDDCLEARKNGALVIASIVASARKIEARLAGLKEGVKGGSGNTA